MRKFLTLALVACLASPIAKAQSKTTEALTGKVNETLTLYFYKNTLRMLNQTEDKAFDELIKDIEKLKFVMIDKESENFGKEDYRKLTTDYQKELYESIMSGRMEGRNFDVYLKEKNGKTAGMVILANDSSSLYVLDMLGSVEITKVPELFRTLDESSEITKKITDFGNKHERRRNREEEGND